MVLLNAITPYLRLLAFLFFALVVVGIIFGVLYLRRARTDRYYVMREKARRRAVWWLSGSGVMFAVGILLLVMSARSPSSPPPDPVPSPAPTAQATDTAEPVATYVPIDDSTPTVIPSPEATRPTATPPFIPTPTPAYPVPDAILTPLPGAVAAGPEAQIDLVTFSADVENGRPVDPGFEFPAGDARINFFFEYSGMAQGVTWTYAWYQNGEYLDGNTCLWGLRDEDCPSIFGRSGTNYLFYRLPGGWVPGSYEVRIWVEERFQGTSRFIVTPAP